MFHYTFRVLNKGSTTIRLQNAEFLDSTGNPIEYEKIDCRIEAIPFSEYVNESYRNLLLDYEELEKK